MKFSEWYEFNCVHNVEDRCSLIDEETEVVLNVFSCYSFYENNIMFSSDSISLKTINTLFGNYNVFKVMSTLTEYKNRSYATFKIFLYPPFLKEKSN